MQESKRQKQVAGLIYQELSDIFQRMGWTVMDGGMISISKVSVTPDLFQVRIYLSMFQVKDKEAALHKIQAGAWEVKKELTARIRHQLRSMPQLEFFLDDTLDYVFKMEALLDKIKKEKDEDNKNGS